MKNGAGITEVNGTGLYYEVEGQGDDLVLIHDGLLGSRIWDDQFGTFAQKYTVTRYDARGYGRSGAPSQAFSDVEDLHPSHVLGGREGPSRRFVKRR